MNETVAAARPTNKALLAVFWLYVLIPLAWGVVNTLATAMKLFSEGGNCARAWCGTRAGSNFAIWLRFGKEARVWRGWRREGVPVTA